MYQHHDINLEREMDKAFIFLAENMSKSGHNPKPVVTHSIMVATTLYELNYSRNIVIAAVLHDLIEDSDVTEKEIEAGFGKEISDLVSALSFDPKIEDKREQTQEHFNRIRTFGKSAALIKTADLYCNLPFVNYVNDFNTHSYLQYKYQLFQDMFADLLHNDPMYQAFQERCKGILREIK